MDVVVRFRRTTTSVNWKL